MKRANVEFTSIRVKKDMRAALKRLAVELELPLYVLLEKLLEPHIGRFENPEKPDPIEQKLCHE